jgi:hypothetical protein
MREEDEKLKTAEPCCDSPHLRLHRQTCKAFPPPEGSRPDFDTADSVCYGGLMTQTSPSLTDAASATSVIIKRARMSSGVWTLMVKGDTTPLIECNLHDGRRCLTVDLFDGESGERTAEWADGAAEALRLAAVWVRTGVMEGRKVYRITSYEGVILGAFEAGSEADALDALARSAGYRNAEHSTSVVGAFYGTVTEVSADGGIDLRVCEQDVENYAKRMAYAGEMYLSAMAYYANNQDGPFRRTWITAAARDTITAMSRNEAHVVCIRAIIEGRKAGKWAR